MKEYMKENLGSFTPSFLYQNFPSRVKLPLKVVELIQEMMDYESATSIFLALIPPDSSEFDVMVEEAINGDGFGHFFNYYDGSSREYEVDGVTFVTFRVD